MSLVQPGFELNPDRLTQVIVAGTVTPTVEKSISILPVFVAAVNTVIVYVVPWFGVWTAAVMAALCWSSEKGGGTKGAYMLTARTGPERQKRVRVSVCSQTSFLRRIFYFIIIIEGA